MSLIPADEFERKLAEQSASLSGAPAHASQTPAAAGSIADRQGADSPAPAGRSLNSSAMPAGAASRGREIARSAPPPGRGLRGQDETQGDDSSMGHRALDLLKQGLPLVQKLLPLLDGNILAVVGNLFAPRPQAPAKVDLAPLENQLTEIQLLHHDLRAKITEHNTSLKGVEDQLEMVKEATDRNTLEQQELMEDLRTMGSRVNLFAALLFALLIVSVILNLVLFMHIRQLLP
jgi:hypothetical protein